MIAAAPSLTPEALPAVTVPSGADDRLQLGERFEASSRADARRVSTTTGSPLRCGISTGDDLRGEPAVRLRRGGLLLAAQREGVLVLAADLELLRDILAGARHRVVAIGVASSSD